VNRTKEPGSVHEPKDGTLTLSLDEAENLINVLLCSLEYDRFIASTLFEKRHEPYYKDNGDFDILFANSVEGGMKKIALLKQILEKAPLIGINEEDKKTVDFWLSIKQKYRDGNAHDT
jgi:hypothetical protein